MTNFLPAENPSISKTIGFPNRKNPNITTYLTKAKRSISLSSKTKQLDFHDGCMMMIAGDG